MYEWECYNDLLVLGRKKCQDETTLESLGLYTTLRFPLVLFLFLKLLTSQKGDKAFDKVKVTHPVLARHCPRILQTKFNSVSVVYHKQNIVLFTNTLFYCYSLSLPYLFLLLKRINYSNIYVRFLSVLNNHY